jgi:3-hydroxybutyryl-CoA dehydrogenase
MSAQAAAGVPATVGVLGGGRMGAGIAHAFLISGSVVAIVERDQQQAAAALGRLANAVLASVDRGVVDESTAEILARVSVSTSTSVFEACELVIEAVPEDVGVKLASLARIEAVVAPATVVATNTSSISVTELATGLSNADRFLGLHFFNPVPGSLLVEIVVGDDTDPAVVTRAQGWVEAIGKTPVTVRDSPGFASSRLGVVIGLEAIRMLEEGVASAADIDAAMVLGYKFPVGPLRLTDIVGLDVRLGIAEYLHLHLGERFAPPQLLRDKVAAGELGRKTGRGFFDWDAQ